jgi:hypothetical protein
MISDMMLSQSFNRVEIWKPITELTLIGNLILHLATDDFLKMAQHMCPLRPIKGLLTENAYLVAQE